MTRLTVLLGVLGILASLLVPYSVMDAAIMRERGAVARARTESLPLARQARDLLRSEAAVKAHREQIAGLSDRLLGEEPFGEMRAVLTGLSGAAGVRLEGWSMEVGGPVADLPELVRYMAGFQVVGTLEGLTAFLRGLEEHRLLIEVPEVRVKPEAGRTVRVEVRVGLFAAQR